MPTYDYRCDNCGHEVEVFQSITAKPLRKCPECGKNTFKRLIGTGAGVLFKGDGFWQTDYRSEGYKKAADAEKPKSETKSETKSDSAASSSDAKPAKPAESKPAKKPGKKPNKKD
ncbi:MAG: zinc ribbon domain-containing protein [Planctomycetes bacterium]|nr:zinc ribbon domain-containing protein [Planctomycetota bacterium]